MQKSGCTAGCGCTNFKADAFKKEKCCNCFHNHYVEAGSAGVKGPAPPPGRKPVTGNAEAFKPQPPVRHTEAKTAASPPSANRNLPAKTPLGSPPPTAHDLAAEAKATADKAAADKAAADKAAADKAAADKAAADKAAAIKAAAAAPVAVKPAKPEEKKPGPPLGKNGLKIAWQQGSRGEYQLDVGDIQNLEQLDARLRRQEASLVGKKIEYLCRGIVVAKAFWDIFRPEHLFPTLYIQEEGGEANSRNRVKATIPGSSGEKKTGFVAPTAGAGFAVPSKVTFQKPVVKVVQAPAAAAAASSGGKAKVGFKADDAWFAARPALFA